MSNECTLCCILPKTSALFQWCYFIPLVDQTYRERKPDREQGEVEVSAEHPARGMSHNSLNIR